MGFIFRLWRFGARRLFRQFRAAASAGARPFLSFCMASSFVRCRDVLLHSRRKRRTLEWNNTMKKLFAHSGRVFLTLVMVTMAGAAWLASMGTIT
jgi:hypothetical protein